MQRLSRNFLALFLSDGITRLIGFAATVYIARLLAVEGFGLISYGVAFISYALLFANPGLSVIGAREVAKAPKDRRFIEETLGLRLVRILAEDQLQGKLEIISKEGTTFRVEFEIKNNGAREM